MSSSSQLEMKQVCTIIQVAAAVNHCLESQVEIFLSDAHIQARVSFFVAKHRDRYQELLGRRRKSRYMRLNVNQTVKV